MSRGTSHAVGCQTSLMGVAMQLLANSGPTRPLLARPAVSIDPINPLRVEFVTGKCRGSAHDGAWGRGEKAQRDMSSSTGSLRDTKTDASFALRASPAVSLRGVPSAMVIPCFLGSARVSYLLHTVYTPLLLAFTQGHIPPPWLPSEPAAPGH